MEPYYHDPLHDDLGQLESSIELSFQPGSVFYENPDHHMDPSARFLGALERSLEGTMVIPPSLYEPESPLQPDPAVKAPLQGPAEGPPLPAESDGPPWISMKPARAAKPFFTIEYIAPFSYFSRGRTGSGSTIGGPWTLARRCPETDAVVTEETCLECEHYRDHGDGPECYYDWLERNQGEPGETGNNNDDY
jgi:hypothetical protein